MALVQIETDNKLTVYVHLLKQSVRQSVATSLLFFLSSSLSFRDNRSESRGDVGQREKREIALCTIMRVIIIISCDVTGFGLWL